MAPDAAADRTILVSADTVSLKLTLSAKLQKRPFSDAVLAPFCKAYNKKKGTDWTVDDLVSVCVDDELMTDYTVAASVVLLSGSTVSAALAFRVTRPEMQLNADPFSGESWSAPMWPKTLPTAIHTVCCSRSAATAHRAAGSTDYTPSSRHMPSLTRPASPRRRSRALGRRRRRGASDVAG